MQSQHPYQTTGEDEEFFTGNKGLRVKFEGAWNETLNFLKESLNLSLNQVILKDVH